ncbi:NDR1/HIN1-like protein 13 [Salvia hispanica]|uniref:NDR1/HIN1-like protein 13 n=1 Tax=Salvia hispanica TaxID=49212 RepID=UPI00200997DB|nr:NDR1/HIN1-like protein 13 [Salvia hispanica]
MAAAADSPPPPPPPPSPAQTKSDQINKPPPTKPAPPTRTYVFQLPREHIFRHPPPENAAKYEKLRRDEERRNRLRRCCLLLLFLLIIILAAAVAVLAIHYVLLFQSPSFEVTEIAVRGLNLTSDAPISPEFDVTVRALNPNRKIGIHYLKESSVDVYCDGVVLGHGALPEFYQPRKNATTVRATAADSSVILGSAVKTELSSAQRRGRVPLVLTVEAPVKFEVGFFNSWWVITAKVKCDVVLDELSDKAQIVSKHCDTDLHF